MVNLQGIGYVSATAATRLALSRETLAMEILCLAGATFESFILKECAHTADRKRQLTILGLP